MKFTTNEVHITGLTSFKTAQARIAAYKRLYDIPEAVAYVRGIFEAANHEPIFLQYDWHEVSKFYGEKAARTEVDGVNTVIRLRAGDHFDMLIGRPAGQQGKG